MFLVIAITLIFSFLILLPFVTNVKNIYNTFMVLNNCFGTINEFGFNVRSIIITAFLAAAMIGYKHIAKKKLSPILLIVFSAGAGIVVYGV